MGTSSITGDETIIFADNASFDGTERGGKLSADGELWIGSSTSPHVVKNTLTAGDGLTITNSTGSITVGGDLATDEEVEFNTYGTTELVSAGKITTMFSSPSAIGDVQSNTGAFTTLTAMKTNSVPATFTQTTTTTDAQNSASRNVHRTSATPVAGFGSGVELQADNDANAIITQARVGGIWTDPSAGSESSYMQLTVKNSGSEVNIGRLYPTRCELISGASLRFGASGADVLTGSGSPNGSVTAAQGSFYLRTDGTDASTIPYYNTDGSTTWVGGGGGGGISSAWTTPFTAFSSNDYFISPINSGALSSSGTPSNQRMYLIPISVGEDCTVTKLRISVGTAVAGAVARLGVYNSSGGLPSTVAIDGGTVSLASTGYVDATVSQALTAGLYYTAFVADLNSGSPAVKKSATNPVRQYWRDSSGTPFFIVGFYQDSIDPTSAFADSPTTSFISSQLDQWHCALGVTL